MNIISVIPLTKIPLPAPQALDYFTSQKIAAGSIVLVTVGRRKISGIVLASEPVANIKQQIKKYSFKLKPIDGVVARDSIVPRHYIKLALWAADYFYSPYGQVMRTFMPQIFSRPTKKLLTELPQLTAALNPDAPRGTRNPKSCPILYWARYSDDARVNFYARKIRQTLKTGQSVLFLVPELYKIEYFQRKISELNKAVIVHGNLTAAAQYKIWSDTFAGKIRCVIGTRSAILMPLCNLGLIIIDEEESLFYKSFDQQPHLNAKTVALKLADLTCANVILGSNLPSIESFWKAQGGEYALKTVSRTQPVIDATIIDMRKELQDGNFSILSRELQTQLLQVIKSKSQAILFINRKGLSTGLLCRDCGHIIECPNCDVPMVYHAVNYTRQEIRYILTCHHCGKIQRPPSICPKCRSYRIKFMGTGTERVEYELQKFLLKHNVDKSHFPIARLDLGITPTWEKQKEVFLDFRKGKFTFLIGTQLMLKANLFPKAYLTSAITIDPLFSLPDFRVYEQAFRIVKNLWALASSKFVLQTYVPNNTFMQKVRDNRWEELFSEELKNRQALSLPPFSQLIKLEYVHADSEKAEQEAQILKKKLETVIRNLKFPPEAPACPVGRDQPLAEEIRNFQILGPAPGFIPRIKNRYIWQIMIKSKIGDLTVRNTVLRVVPSNWKIDVDPVLLL